MSDPRCLSFHAPAPAGGLRGMPAFGAVTIRRAGEVWRPGIDGAAPNVPVHPGAPQ